MRVAFVEHLPDLIDSREYAADPKGRKVRVRIRVTAERVELFGDAVQPVEMEALLAALGAECIEQMLCGWQTRQMVSRELVAMGLPPTAMDTDARSRAHMATLVKALIYGIDPFNNAEE
jgi:hypothetical protein